MLLWILFAILTAFVLIGLMWPFVRTQDAALPRESFNVTVYKDQLKEIERDFERGLIEKAEAETAKVEVARRLLATHAKNEASHGLEERPPTAAPDQNTNEIPTSVLVLSALCIPILSIALYLFLGAPHLPNQSFAARQAAPLEQQPVTVLIGRMEDHLKRFPKDGKGWDLIAPIYLRLRRFEDAALAYRNALQFQGETAARRVNYAESLYWANNQIVTQDVEEAFLKALALKPDMHVFRARLANAYEQKGQTNKAIQSWRNLRENANQDERVLQLAEVNLNRLENNSNDKTSQSAQNFENGRPNANVNQSVGPTAEDIQAAQQLTPEQRSDMIVSMVEGLASRLDEDGGNVQEWSRLIRAYMVLGDSTAAAEAVRKARENLKENTQDLAAIEALVKDLKLSL